MFTLISLALQHWIVAEDGKLVRGVILAQGEHLMQSERIVRSSMSIRCHRWLFGSAWVPLLHNMQLVSPVLG